MKMSQERLDVKLGPRVSVASLILLMIALSMSFVGQGEPPWLTAIYQPLIDTLDPWYRNTALDYFDPFYWLAFGLSLLGTLLAWTAYRLKLNRYRPLTYFCLVLGISLTLWTWVVAAGGL